MITITELNKSFGDKKVLNGLSCTLDDGMIHGLVGLNGSGKTTLLRIISRNLKPDGGTVLINGQPATKKVLMLLETEPFFYHGINGREYLSLFRTEDPVKFDINGWAELFHLPLGDLIDNYSTGMKKKLALIALLKTGKPVMMLDEPFNGLDLESSRVLSRVLKKLCVPGKTIIITSHMLETLGDLCDRIHYLSEGTIRKTYQQEEKGIIAAEIFHEFDKRTEAVIDRLVSGIIN